MSTASSQDEIISALRQAGIRPAVSYSVPGLVSIHHQAGPGDCYLLWGGGTTLTVAAAAGDTGIRVVSTAGLQAGQQLIIGTGASRETVTIASVPSPAPGSGPNVLLTAALRNAHAGPTSSGTFFGGLAGAGVSGVVSSRITIAGAGQPYWLDAWTGAAVPLPVYTAGPGTISFDLTLLPGAAAIIAVGGAPPGGAASHAISSTGGQVTYSRTGQLVHQAAAAGTYTVGLSTGPARKITVASVPAALSLGDGWNLTLDSWGPDDTANPTISAKTTVSFSGITLGTWASLPASSSQLTALGVSSMSQVAGTGSYSRQFSLPSGWTPDNGAYLQLAHGQDMVVAVSVNGHALPTIDQFSDQLDLGGYLTPGPNTITVRIDTTLNNRITGKTAQLYGLTGAQLTPYQQTVLG